MNTLNRFSFTLQVCVQVLAIAAVLCAGEAQSKTNARMPFKAQAPRVLQQPGAKTSSRSGTVPRVTLEDFWIIGCPGCTADLPVIVSCYKKYRKQGMEVEGICLDDRHTRAEIKQFEAKNGITWHGVYDPGGWGSPLIKPYHAESLPFTVLRGRDGKILALNLHGPALRAAIQKALFTER